MVNILYEMIKNSARENDTSDENNSLNGHSNEP